MNYHHQYQQSENRHKLKYLHLTYKGHYQLPVPEDWKYEFLFYCYENEMTDEEEEEIYFLDQDQEGDNNNNNNSDSIVVLSSPSQEQEEEEKYEQNEKMELESQSSQESLQPKQKGKQQQYQQARGIAHTHMGIKLTNGITRKSIIKQLSPLLQIPCLINVATHRKFESIIGYHTGFGDKPPCNNNGDKILRFKVVYPPNLDAIQYRKDRLAHYRTNRAEICKAQNELILQNTTNDLIKQGLLHMRQYSVINTAKHQFELAEEAAQFAKKPDFIEIPGQFDKDSGKPVMLKCNFKLKKRHYWIKGPKNSGKTTFSQGLLKKYRAAITEHDQGSFEDVQKGTQLLIMDAAQPDNKPPLSELERLCDGTKKLKILYSGPRKIGTVIVIILSNYSLKETYHRNVDVHDILSVRFNEIHLTNTFPDTDDKLNENGNDDDFRAKMTDKTRFQAIQNANSNGPIEGLQQKQQKQQQIYGASQPESKSKINWIAQNGSNRQKFQQNKEEKKKKQNNYPMMETSGNNSRRNQQYQLAFNQTLLTSAALIDGFAINNLTSLKRNEFSNDPNQLIQKSTQQQQFGAPDDDATTLATRNEFKKQQQTTHFKQEQQPQIRKELSSSPSSAATANSSSRSSRDKLLLMKESNYNQTAAELLINNKETNIQLENDCTISQYTLETSNDELDEEEESITSFNID